MLDNYLKEILDARLPAKNLRYALVAVGYAIMGSLMAYLVMEGFAPVHSLTVIRVEIGVYFLLTIASGVYAFLAVRNSIKSLKTSRDVRNYIALIIGGLLLLGIARMILMRI